MTHRTISVVTFSVLGVAVLVILGALLISVDAAPRSLLLAAWVDGLAGGILLVILWDQAREARLPRRTVHELEGSAGRCASQTTHRTDLAERIGVGSLRSRRVEPPPTDGTSARR